VSSRRWRTLVSAKSIVGYPTWTTDSAFLFFDEAGVRMRLRIADGHKETAYSYQGLRRLNRLGAWVDNAPDGSILTLRDTSLDEIFALALE
jgi:hypothetical protein